jgi:hypothetical protein
MPEFVELLAALCARPQMNDQAFRRIYTSVGWCAVRNTHTTRQRRRRDKMAACCTLHSGGWSWLGL